MKELLTESSFLSLQVENRLKELETVGTQDELLQSFKHYGDDLMKLAKLTGLRQAV